MTAGGRGAALSATSAGPGERPRARSAAVRPPSAPFPLFSLSPHARCLKTRLLTGVGLLTASYEVPKINWRLQRARPLSGQRRWPFATAIIWAAPRGLLRPSQRL